MINVEFFKKQLMDAMRNKETIKKECLQVLLSTIHNKEIEKKASLNEYEIVKIIHKEIKQLNEVINLVGDRDTSIEETKITYLKQFLPEQFSEDEILHVIKKMCNGMNNKGQIMKTVIPIFHGRADNKSVSKMVDKFLKL